jgi:HAE1 family hydrophobic/amphiphilic exporter-1
MFVLFWIVLGFVSYNKMNVERMPPMDLPIVTTTLLYPGAGPSEIEAQIVKPVEDTISKVSGIKKISSTVYENYAYIVTEFNLGENGLEKQQEIKGQVDSIVYDLPEDMEQPVVKKLNINQQTVMDLAVSGADLREAYEFADKILSQRMAAIPGVASVDIFGGRERAIRVYLDPQRMTAKGISVTAILQAIAAHNLNVPSGKVETRFSSNAIRFIGEFASVDEIGNMAIATSEGMTFKLKDIARIEDSAKSIETGGRYNGDDVLILSIVKATDGNAVKISNVLQERMGYYNELARRELKNQNAQVQIITDSAESIRREVKSTLWGILFGIILTVIVLYVFTRSLHSTIISAVVIPVSMIAGFLPMSSAGFSINNMTLLAIASVLGSLIFNAIILIEAALQQMGEGKTPRQAAIDGAKKVFVPILAGAGTNVIVFLPMAFMGGIAGLFMKQFGMTVVYLTVVSMLFSFTLSPMMIAAFMKPVKKAKGGSDRKKNESAIAWFRPWFKSQEAHPWRWVGLSALILVLSAFLMRYVGNEFAPASDTSEINITARAPMGSTYEKTEKLAKRIEEKLSAFPEVSAMVVKIGRRGLQNVSVNAKLVPLSRRESDKKVAQKMIVAFSDIPDAEFMVRAGEASGGSSYDMVVNVLGDADADRERVADELVRRINTIDAVQGAFLAAQVPNDEIRFIPSQKKMNEWGATNAAVGGAMRLAFYGDDNLKYREAGDEYPLLVEFDKRYKTADTFSEILVDSKRGMVPMTELGSVKYLPASRNIYRVDKHRLTEIDVNLGKSTIGPVRAQIMDEVKKMDVPDGVRVVFGGMSEMQDETTGEMANAFLLAAIMTVMLLAAIMNSIAHPLTISTAILTSFSGVFVMLFLSGGTINVSALMSIIMLIGLSVNNGVLLLEGAVRRVDNEGAELSGALWDEYVDKWRMVLMTTIAVAAGMLPQLFANDTSKISMAAVLIGGMVGGLADSFILTPALFFLVERMKHKKAAKHK